MTDDWTTYLCLHDPRNTEGCTCGVLNLPDDEPCPGRTDDCSCDNCFYGRDRLARALLDAAEELGRLRQSRFCGHGKHPANCGFCCD